MSTVTDFSQPAAILNDGASMPLLGLGTWQIPDDEVADAVRIALDYGYRHIDTATRYRNEAGIGRALRESEVPRDAVFVTTKFPPDQIGREREILAQSLENLGLDRVDLWLIHAPGGQDRTDPLLSTWEQFIAAREDGLVSSIGVSNYTLEQIDLLTERTGVRPAVNQIKWSPSLHRPEIARGHGDRGVVLETFSAFRFSNLDDPVLTEVANAHHCSTAQVIIAWHAAHGFVAIPKSTHADRIRANADGIRLTLTADEVARIDALGADEIS